MGTTLAIMWLAAIGAPQGGLDDQKRVHCYEVLVRALEDESPTVRVHAADALVSLGRPGPALEAFRPRRETAEPVQRILAWRVLAAAEPEAEWRRVFVGRIRAALLDPEAPDRTHAMESLAKLGVPADDDGERRCIRAFADSGGPEAPFALWRLVLAGESAAVDRLAALLRSPDIVTRLRAAYVLGRLRSTHPKSGAVLLAALRTEPPDSPARPVLLAAAGAATARELLDEPGAPPGDRYFAAMSLAESGTPDDDPWLARSLADPHADLRVGAAYARLRIDARAVVQGRPTATEAAPP